MRKKYLGLTARAWALVGLAVWLLGLGIGVTAGEGWQDSLAAGTGGTLFTVGFWLIAIGAVLTMKESRRRGAYAMLFGGIAAMGFSIVLLRMAIDPNRTGVVIIGFIPLPLIVIPIVGFIVGGVLALGGVRGFFRKQGNSA